MSESMSDDEFLCQFERLVLNPECFNHEGHCRLAWIYLRRLPMDEAIQRACVNIKAFASSLGASDKFHFTMTQAFMCIIAVMVARSQTHTFSQGS